MAKVAFPARCGVAVICGDSLISQVYPAAVPIEVFVDNAIELLNDDLKRRGEPGLDPANSYELQRANGTRLDVRKTLEELGIEDGTALILASADEGDSFEPQYESLSTGLARVGRNLFAPVTAETAVRVALVILSVVVMTVIALSVFVRANGDSPIPAAVCLLTGALAAGPLFAVWRWWRERSDLMCGLGWPAVALAATGVAMAAPGELGAAHLFIGLLALAVLACGMEALTQAGVLLVSAAVTAAGIAMLMAGIRMWGPVSFQRLGICALITQLVLLSAAPTLALWAARIRPPHFGSITGRDLFRRGDGMPVDAVAPVEEVAEEESNPDRTPTGHAIAQAAARANGVLTGICCGVAIALPVAVWAVVVPGAPYATAATAVGLLFVWIFVSRARAFSDRRQAVALVGGAALALVAGTARFVLHGPGGSPVALLWGTVFLLVTAAAGLGAALLVPVTRFTPIVRMIVEWLELAAIVAALPLAAWIAGLFTWIRMK